MTIQYLRDQAERAIRRTRNVLSELEDPELSNVQLERIKRRVEEFEQIEIEALAELDVALIDLGVLELPGAWATIPGED